MTKVALKHTKYASEHPYLLKNIKYAPKSSLFEF
jgi:hypothetical protein